MMLFPIPGVPRVTSPYGARRLVAGSNPPRYTGHSGVDLAADFVPLVAPDDGAVWTTGRDDVSGLYVCFRAFVPIGRVGYRMAFCHMSEIVAGLAEGVHRADPSVAFVRRGQRLGTTGNTGRVRPAPTPENPRAGKHLHVRYERQLWSGAIEGASDGLPAMLEAETWEESRLVDGFVLPGVL
jgi:murein DD-endopeptidase MepM/ murein hydrolase activator NlpD